MKILVVHVGQSLLHAGGSSSLSLGLCVHFMYPKLQLVWASYPRHSSNAAWRALRLVLVGMFHS